MERQRPRNLPKRKETSGKLEGNEQRLSLYTSGNEPETTDRNRGNEGRRIIGHCFHRLAEILSAFETR